ncbi:hypothetical protein POTOM_004565 [Populus tomentosa]|uniref:Uncharacterized protein n=1 Tax=Populus tomentosa TaxID=118781 RepID=A0A8X8AFK2_POPTO|nr:hypothetical protein POTOM_004565 [Populus tomentosa]
MENGEDSQPISFMETRDGDRDSSNSSSVAVYWESCKPSFQCVDLGSETVVDKKVMEWETKINKGDVVSSKDVDSSSPSPEKSNDIAANKNGQGM